MNNKQKILNKINQILKKDDRIFTLCKNQKEIFSDLNIYILNILSRLWKCPKIIALIIENAETKVLKEHLAPLFVHNFYENIISSDCIEDNLIYILSLLIQSETKELNYIAQKKYFLVNTPCGIMLEEIFKKVEVQMYLNEITKNAIENLEKNYSNQLIDFNLDKISDELKNNLQNEVYNNINRSEEFQQKYILNLDESSIEKLLVENINDKNMTEFLNTKLSEFSKNDRQNYSNKKFLSVCYQYKNSDKFPKNPDINQIKTISLEEDKLGYNNLHIINSFVLRGNKD